jgi:hypothetical protein
MFWLLKYSGDWYTETPLPQLPRSGLLWAKATTYIDTLIMIYIIQLEFTPSISIWALSFSLTDYMLTCITYITYLAIA